MLVFGHENVWTRTLVKIEIAAVFGDADNLYQHSIDAPFPKAFADRVLLAAVESAGELLIDDRDLCGVVIVVFGEIAAQNKRRLHRLEILRGDNVGGDCHPLPRLRLRVAFFDNRSAPRFVVTEREKERQRSGAHSGLRDDQQVTQIPAARATALLLSRSIVLYH